jgi:hypothetical protein
MRGLVIPQRFNKLPGSGKNQARRIPREMVRSKKFSLRSFKLSHI